MTKFSLIPSKNSNPSVGINEGPNTNDRKSVKLSGGEGKYTTIDKNYYLCQNIFAKVFSSYSK
jgi:hypothetical protein